MHFPTTLKRNLLFLLAIIFTLSLHSTVPSAPLPVTGGPANASPTTHVVNKKLLGASFKQVKQAAKKYLLLVKQLKKKYQNDAVMSTVLIALLMAIGLGALIYLLSYAGISGILITAVGIVGFAVIIYWAVKRIRWNAQY